VALPIIAQYCATAIATTIAANPIVTPKRCPKNLCCRSLSSSIGAPKVLIDPVAVVSKESPGTEDAIRLVPGLQDAPPIKAIVLAESQ
jgi:hypothetical protein